MARISISAVSLFILGALIVCTGCPSLPGAAKKKVPNIEVEVFLSKQGFDGEFSTPAVTDWERQTFNLLEKEQWLTKSRAEVPNWERAYYRYTIVKETYQSRQEAKDRSNRIREQPPSLGGEPDKAFPLRAGFAFDKNVYVVSCQVSMFHEHMKKFTRELEQAISTTAGPRK